MALTASSCHVPATRAQTPYGLAPPGESRASRARRIAEIGSRFKAVGLHRGFGVAVVAGDSVEYYGYGARSAVSPVPPDRDTVFEIGSVSKVFVGLLLADAARRGEVHLDDPAHAYLPDLPIPSRPQHPITLEHLASFTSGLPFFPDNWVGVDPVTHRTRYRVEHFREFLAHYTLPRDPGVAATYGNTGTGLLALALSARTQRSFASLLRDRIFAPLGMTRSGYPDERPPEDANVSQGYDEDDVPSPWRLDTSPMGPCCAVRSTLADVATFARAALSPSGELAPALHDAATPRVATEFAPDERFGLGWRIRGRDGVVWKDGQVSGHRTVVALVPGTRRALVVFVNSYQADIRGLAFALLSEVLDVRETQSSEDGHRAATVAAIDEGAAVARATFDANVTLEGWTVPGGLRRGERATVSLFFRSLHPVPRDTRVFVHGDAQGAPRLRFDHFPSQGRDSTVRWRPGELVRDDFELRVPDDYPRETFTLWFGLLDDEHRLEARTETLPTDDNRVRGPRVEVTPGAHCQDGL